MPEIVESDALVQARFLQCLLERLVDCSSRFLPPENVLSVSGLSPEDFYYGLVQRQDVRLLALIALSRQADKAPGEVYAVPSEPKNLALSHSCTQGYANDWLQKRRTCRKKARFLFVGQDILPRTILTIELLRRYGVLFELPSFHGKIEHVPEAGKLTVNSPFGQTCVESRCLISLNIERMEFR